MTKEQITKWLHATQDGHHVTLSHAESVSVFDLALRGLEATWRPIETAPKDGTRALLRILAVDDPVVVTGRFRSGGWRFGQGVDTTIAMNVTHWMPLPSTEVP